ncbi:hypothetical protein [Mesorhizobium sp. SP-1A]|uniref:hypothetical protein n=1 Tax=Mesorhizobium sp. SP-1A TaxID=3077840 RepID=UPI0028F6E026|nr:hypothetical protein [Mesorhizobium sp. SP-1A]
MPAPDRADCAALPSRCGYPDATNTGPGPGTVFRRVPEDIADGPGWQWDAKAGSLRVTGAGTVLEGIEVHGSVLIDAPDVTLRDSKVFACNSYWIVAIRAGRPADGYTADGARIENNMIGCDGPPQNRSDRGVSDVYGAAKRVLVRANNIWNVSNGVSVEVEGLIQGNFVHDLGNQPGDHHSGLSNHGGASNVVFDLNTVLLSQENVSAPITVYSDFVPAQNVTISRNLVSGGSYCFYGGDSGAFAPARGRIRILNNRLSEIYGQQGHCGTFGQVASFALNRGNEWSGNVWDDNLQPVGIGNDGR